MNQWAEEALRCAAHHAARGPGLGPGQGLGQRGFSQGVGLGLGQSSLLSSGDGVINVTRVSPLQSRPHPLQERKRHEFINRFEEEGSCALAHAFATSGRIEVGIRLSQYLRPVGL